MSLRVRRSIRIAPGVRLNVTKTGFGVTAGPKGVHYSIHSSGQRTMSLGLPGTGLYYQQRSTGGNAASPARQPATGGQGQAVTAPFDPVRLIPKPGFFASGQEKAYHEGLLAYLRGDRQVALAAFERVLAADASAISAHLFAGVTANSLGDEQRTIAHLEAVVGAPAGLPDRYQLKYLPAGLLSLTLPVKVTRSITATPPFGELAAVLALAESYQSAGRLDEAIGILQQLHAVLPDPLIRLSLCDLLFADADYEAVVEMSVGLANDSDIDVETLHLRGAAFLALGHGTAATDAFRDALRKTVHRDPGLLKAVRYDRALAFEQLGQRARATADLERLYAADPGYEDVRARLSALGRP